MRFFFPAGRLFEKKIIDRQTRYRIIIERIKINKASQQHADPKKTDTKTSIGNDSFKTQS